MVVILEVSSCFSVTASSQLLTKSSGASSSIRSLAKRTRTSSASSPASKKKSPQSNKHHNSNNSNTSSSSNTSNTSSNSKSKSKKKEKRRSWNIHPSLGSFFLHVRSANPGDTQRYIAWEISCRFKRWHRSNQRPSCYKGQRPKLRPPSGASGVCFQKINRLHWMPTFRDVWCSSGDWAPNSAYISGLHPFLESLATYFEKIQTKPGTYLGLAYLKCPSHGCSPLGLMKLATSSLSKGSPSTSPASHPKTRLGLMKWPRKGPQTATKKNVEKTFLRTWSRHTSKAAPANQHEANRRTHPSPA